MDNLFQAVINILLSLTISHGGGGGIEVGPAVRIDTGGTQPAFVQLVANRGGEMLAQWQVYGRSVDNEIWFNRYQPGAGWGEARRWSESAIISDIHPVLADNGTAGVLWNQSISVWSNTLVEGAVGVQEQRDPDAASPRLKAGPPAGDPLLCALWIEQVNETLQSADYHLGSGWTGPVAVPLLTAEERARDPPLLPRPHGINLAVSAQGERLAVWSSLTDIRANRWTPGLSWSEAEIVAVPVQTVFSDPYLALGDGGAAVVVWTEPAGLGERFLAVHSKGAGWSAPQVFAEQEGLFFGGVQLVVDPAGEAVAVWQQTTTAGSAVYAVRYREGRWEAPLALGAGVDPDLAMNAAGDVAVVWQTTTTIQARGLRRGAPAWTAAAALTGEGTFQDPQVALQPDGTWVAVWTDTESRLWGITAQLRD